ncbi:MAG: hypothetical protein ACYC1I_11280, partial [Acidimicrobiales bacterium]
MVPTESTQERLLKCAWNPPAVMLDRRRDDVVVVVDAVGVNPCGVGHVVDVPVIGWPAWSASAPSIMHFMIG